MRPKPATAGFAARHLPERPSGQPGDNGISATDLAKKIGAEIAVNPDRAARILLHTCRRADRISDLLTAADGHALLITELANHQLARVAELLDVAAICLVNGVVLDADLREALQRCGTVVLISPVAGAETARRSQSAMLAPAGDPS